MGSLDGSITFKTAEYRACLADGKKALFHRWTQVSEIVPPALTVGGHNGGVVSGTLALVEYENGEVAEVLPKRIKFLDGKEMFEECCFFEENQGERKED